MATFLSDPDPLETRAIDDFEKANGPSKFEKIAILIPAFKEAASIEGVLRKVPRTILGLGVTVLVIVDGSEDGTSDISRRQGAFVTATGGHRGQGAGLRLGYKLAVAHGSDYIVSLDADDQYISDEIAVVLEPLVRGEADFVSGSRRLGADGTSDKMRSLGIDVFATLITVLTGHRITDPAFGLRAMTAAVCRAAVLEQPQYQASELLIGTIFRGFRVTERPATLNKRKKDKSKKGRNFVYGYRFTKVVLRTWWRDRGLRGRETSGNP